MGRRSGWIGMGAVLAAILAGCAVAPDGAGGGTASAASTSGADEPATSVSASGVASVGSSGASSSAASAVSASSSSGGPAPSSSGDLAPSSSGDRASGNDRPILGTTWYYTELVNNDLPMRLPADPDAWIRFADGTLTVNGTTEREMGGEPLPCKTLRVPATVSNGVLTFAKDAASVPDANNLCGARVELHAAVKVAVKGTELRMSVDEGMNKSVRIFSSSKPVPPAVPDSVDLAFLGPPADRMIREKLANVLSGRAFVATKISGRTIAKPGISMAFGVDQVSINSGCNSGSAGYHLSGPAITFTDGAWSQIGCDDARMQQENWLHTFITGPVDLQLAGSTLRLTAHGQTMVLDEQPAHAKPQHSAPVPSAAPTDSGDAPPELLMGTIDEIVTPLGVQPVPAMESGEFWSQPPNLTIETGAIVFDVGCGQLWSDTTGTFPKLTAGSYDGTWLLQCPPKRSALAAALRYILSGPLTIERDGAFLTITGRDGLVVTAHSGR